MIRLTRAETTAIFWIAYNNLQRSTLEITRATDEDNVFVTVTSPEAPGAQVMYEVTSEGGHEVVKKEGFIDGLVKQNTDEPED